MISKYVQSNLFTTHVGFAESKETADDRANIDGTIIGAPIVGQQLALYIYINRTSGCRL